MASRSILTSLLAFGLIFCTAIVSGETDEDDNAARLRGFAARAKEARGGQEAANLVEWVLKNQDINRMKILLDHPATRSWVWRRYPEISTSPFKDRITISCIARPWEDYDRDANGQRPQRIVLPSGALQPFIDYMQARLGHPLPGFETLEKQDDAALSLKGRTALAHKFEEELVQVGLASPPPPTPVEPTAVPLPLPAPETSAPAPISTSPTERSIFPWIFGGILATVFGLLAFIGLRKRSGGPRDNRR